jgi:hypothetical protein
MRKTFRLKNSSSTHFLRNTRVIVWPTKSLTKKSKKIFVKKTKFFSAELGTTLKKYKMHKLNFNTTLMPKTFRLPCVPMGAQVKPLLDANAQVKPSAVPIGAQVKHGRLHLNKGQPQRDIYLKNFWFLRNAALVPGIHKMRKPKSFSLVQKNSSYVLRFWLGKVPFSKISRFLKKTNTNKRVGNMQFISAIESLPFVLFQKAF